MSVFASFAPFLVNSEILAVLCIFQLLSEGRLTFLIFSEMLLISRINLSSLLWWDWEVLPYYGPVSC